MALTLVEAAKLTQDVLLKGVIETIIIESAVLRYLPFMTLNGNSLRYNDEATLGNADFYAVGDTWSESSATFNPREASLTILGGDADVDQFLQQTYSNTNNLRAIVIEKKSKAIAQAFNLNFFAGDSAVNAKQFNGLKKICGAVNNSTSAYSSSVRAASVGANGAVLEPDHMDELVDAVKPGKPDVLFMSKRTRRKLSSLRRASGAVLEVSTDQFGRRVTMWDGIPIEVDENLPDNEAQGTSNDCSSIYGVKFGAMTGICGLQNGSISVVPIGNLETKDAWRTRIKWYVGLASFNALSIARLAGVRV